MRLAVFRAVADGRLTAARLAAHGHEAVLAPVIRFAPTGTTIAAGQTDAVVFTSQHAVESLRGADLQPLLELPCFCVGGRTAAAARQAGFDSVHPGGGDAEALTTTIIGRCPPGTRITFVAGRDRKPGLEAALAERGFQVRVIEAYAAEAIEAWIPEVVEALARCEGALHYSARSAELACTRCEAAHLDRSLRAWIHGCLSADVARPLRARTLPNLRIASAPQETALLALF